MCPDAGVRSHLRFIYCYTYTTHKYKRTFKFHSKTSHWQKIETSYSYQVLVKLQSTENLFTLLLEV